MNATTDRLIRFRVCADCLQAIEYGVECLDLDAERLEEVRDGLARAADLVGLHAVLTDDCELVGGFGWYPCGLCGSGLGGDRLEVAGWVR